MKNLFYIMIMVLTTTLSCGAVSLLDEQPQVEWTMVKEDVHGTNFDVEISAAADSDGAYTEYGICIWDKSGNLVYENVEDIFSSGEILNVWYNLSGLQSDADYTYQVYVVYEGESYYSPYGNFTISDDI